MKNIVAFFLKNRLFTYILFGGIILGGIMTVPFDWDVSFVPREPTAVDAIPDIGENQQIVITEWEGQAPQDIEDQVTYPLTTTLLGLPEVKTIRSSSIFGISFIYIIFEDDADFYWTRERILEKLNSLPKGLLPEGVTPTLGPDATGLGQIFWYTLEGYNKKGEPAGGWNLDELRTVQEFYIKPALSSVQGVSEVASIGGHLKEYKILLDPEKMKYYSLGIPEVVEAVKKSNKTVGAQTMEVNMTEYFVRGFGYVQSVEDLKKSVVKFVGGTAVRLEDIAFVTEGPAPRRGIFDKDGAEAVGGVVISRYGENPLKVIKGVKEKIKEIAPGLPTKTLEGGIVSKIRIVPFYDRTDLIKETLGTLNEALLLEILITLIVIIYFLSDVRSTLVVTVILPLSVLGVFIIMKLTDLPANIVSLSGIAIAIGTLVDMGIVLTENVIKYSEREPNKPLIERIYNASMEVIPAIVTSASTTIISFLPVFSLQATEGKLFKPLAFTKTFALMTAIGITITILPTVIYILFKINFRRKLSMLLNGILLGFSLFLLFRSYDYLNYAVIGIVIGIANFLPLLLRGRFSEKVLNYLKNGIYILLATYFLTLEWLPLGTENSLFTNLLFTFGLVIFILGWFSGIIYFYEKILRFLLRFRYVFIALLIGMIAWGVQIFKHTPREFMPALDEGSFLLMPIALPHAGYEPIQASLRLLDLAVYSIPEVEGVLGKAGRIESAVDPAPLGMYENIILYKSKYITDKNGYKKKFKTDKKGRYFISYKGEQILYDRSTGNFLPYKNKKFFDGLTQVELVKIKKQIDKFLIEDKIKGKYFRQWRDKIQSPSDIWKEIEKATQLPWLTPSPKLQPIQTRIIMLQTGMRSPIGIKVFGPDLKTIEQFGLKLEKLLQNVEGIKKSTIYAERVIGKPYQTLYIDRDKLQKYGLKISDVQNQFKAAAGGVIASYTVEGRERYAIRIRYPRELRNYPDKLEDILIQTPAGYQIPLGEVAEVVYEAGPQVVKSENSFLVSYVFFDKDEGWAEIDAVEQVKKYLNEKIEKGELEVPAGVSYTFEGNYKNQLRANKRLSLVIPLALTIILLILYLQFSELTLSLIVFSAVAVAFSGGLIMMHFYGQSGFLNFEIFGKNFREIMNIHPINLSVAVWVGFLALFGIATDDGVLIATLIQQQWQKQTPKTREEIREVVVTAGKLRVRPAIMTTATTLLALLPVINSTGRGSDIMIPMAIPTFGGMTFATITIFTVPILFYTLKTLTKKQ